MVQGHLLYSPLFFSLWKCTSLFLGIKGLKIGAKQLGLKDRFIVSLNKLVEVTSSPNNWMHFSCDTIKQDNDSLIQLITEILTVPLLNDNMISSIFTLTNLLLFSLQWEGNSNLTKMRTKTKLTFLLAWVGQMFVFQVSF